MMKPVKDHFLEVERVPVPRLYDLYELNYPQIEGANNLSRISGNQGQSPICGHTTYGHSHTTQWKQISLYKLAFTNW